jgi:hypothetical protein
VKISGVEMLYGGLRRHAQTAGRRIKLIKIKLEGIALVQQRGLSAELALQNGHGSRSG